MNGQAKAFDQVSKHLTLIKNRNELSPKLG